MIIFEEFENHENARELSKGYESLPTFVGINPKFNSYTSAGPEEMIDYSQGSGSDRYQRLLLGLPLEPMVRPRGQAGNE